MPESSLGLVSGEDISAESVLVEYGLFDLKFLYFMGGVVMAERLLKTNLRRVSLTNATSKFLWKSAIDRESRSISRLLEWLNLSKI